MTSESVVQLGRYQLHQRIGTGGMSELYVARYAHAAEVERTCVVKRLLPELASQPGMVAMFLDEARINLLLDHPNIVSVFDAGFDDGEIFIAMDHVDGWDLRWVLSACARAGKRIPPRLAHYLAGELLRALDHAHNARSSNGAPLRLVHRDISPENVLVDRSGRVRLGDFGAAHSAISLAPQVRGKAVGKLVYMAPETLERGETSPASDLFATALVLLEMLAGRSLVTAGTAREAIRFWQEFDATLEVPRAVSLADGGALLVRALDSDPGRRWDSAGRFLREVREYLLRRGRGVGGADLGEFVRQLEDSGDESGRIFTAPVDLPSSLGLQADAAWYAWSGGQVSEALTPREARAWVESGAGEDRLICAPGRYWQPVAEVFGGDVPGASARRVSGLGLGPSLLTLTEGSWRATLWLKRQLLALDLVDGRITRALRFHPASGAPQQLQPGAPAAASTRAALYRRWLGPEQLNSLHRRELRQMLAFPLAWDEMWWSATPLEGSLAGGIELTVALVDAAHEVNGGPRIDERIGRAGGTTVEATARPTSLALEAALYKDDLEVLAEVRRGTSFSGLLRGHQADPQSLFQSLFVLRQAGLVAI